MSKCQMDNELGLKFQFLKTDSSGSCLHADMSMDLNPSCASPLELYDLAYLYETKVLFFKNAFPTTADYCFA